jgi:hypothetical protein
MVDVRGAVTHLWCFHDVSKGGIDYGEASRVRGGARGNENMCMTERTVCKTSVFIVSVESRHLYDEIEKISKKK